jgi:crotonobetainyl-CoA:carnitine CoA-transferase CaiB-like acyl-CoA transferase
MDAREPKLTGNAHPNIYPYDAFPTGTAPIFLAVGNDRQFRLLCRHLGQPGLAEDPAYASAGARSRNRQSLRERLVTLLSEHDGPALAEALMDIGVPCAPVLSVSAALQHPHTAHREMVVRIGDDYTGVGSPIKLSRTPASYRLPPPL